jgi:hypothetical protein
MSLFQLSSKTVATLARDRCISSASALHLSYEMPFPGLLSMTYRRPLYFPVVTCKSFFATKPRNSDKKSFPFP